jgi:hypothetical protein
MKLLAVALLHWRQLDAMHGFLGRMISLGQRHRQLVTLEIFRKKQGNQIGETNPKLPTDSECIS